MRIIAGDKRGIRMETLPGQDTRPTLERVKEGIFSSIQFILPGAAVLDLYAGSGQLGIEALSRGAAFCTFVDDNREAVSVVKQNLEKAGLTTQGKVLQAKVGGFLTSNTEKFDIIFIDPPYGKGTFPVLLKTIVPVVAGNGIVICESEQGVDFPENIDGLVLKKQYRYGTVIISRFQKEV